MEEPNPFSKFDPTNLKELANINPDFLFIFQCAFLSTEEKIKIQHGVYEDYLNNKKFYNKRHLLFARYLDGNFEYIGHYRSKDDIEDKYYGNDYTILTLQIDGEPTGHIYTQTYHDNCSDNDYRSSFYAT